MFMVRQKPRSQRAPLRDGAIARAHPVTIAAVTTVGALAISALVNDRLARNAERANPPAGQFLEVNGVRLHYVERGSGTSSGCERSTSDWLRTLGTARGVRW
jgi:hypothetical protein